MYDNNSSTFNNYHGKSGNWNRSGTNYSHGGHSLNRGGTRNTRPALPVKPYKPLDDDTYVDEAEAVIKALMGSNEFKLTTSKIRNLLAMSSEILNKVNNELGKTTSSSAINNEIKKEIGYLRIRTVYECGRESSVEIFVKHSHVLECLKDVKTLGDAELFCHYMEALVAFHRFYGGSD
jgi:CRISPR-associated protein Csm2